MAALERKYKAEVVLLMIKKSLNVNVEILVQLAQRMNYSKDVIASIQQQMKTRSAKS